MRHVVKSNESKVMSVPWSERCADGHFADSLGDSCDFGVAGNVYQQNPMVVQGAVVQGQVIGVGSGWTGNPWKSSQIKPMETRDIPTSETWSWLNVCTGPPQKIPPGGAPMWIPWRLGWCFLTQDFSTAVCCSLAVEPVELTCEGHRCTVPRAVGSEPQRGKPRSPQHGIGARFDVESAHAARAARSGGSAEMQKHSETFWNV